MLQMYKVFINDSPLFIHTADGFKPQNHRKIKPLENGDMMPKKLATIFAHPEFIGGSFACETNITECWMEWKSQFINLDAAGGLVLRDDGCFLGMYRLGKWDLPKGKAEKGETMETTSIREVEEECGIRGVRIEKPLIETYHVYALRDQFVLKKTYWYLMYWRGEGELIPESAEGIEELRWFAPHEAEAFCANTYRSVAEVVQSFFGE